MLHRLKRGLVVLFLLLAPVSMVSADTLNAGWSSGEPQQFIQRRGGYEVLTGLDIEMVRAIAERAGHTISFTAMSWTDLVAGIGTGSTDLAPGTAWTDERATAAVLSRPYRFDTDVLIVRRGESSRMGAKSAADLRLALQRDASFRIGV